MLGGSWRWYVVSIPTDVAFEMHRKFEPIFKKRRVPESLVYLERGMFLIVVVMGALPAIGHLNISHASYFWIATLAAYGVCFLLKRRYATSGLVFRNSWEEADSRSEKLWRIIPSVVSFFVGLFARAAWEAVKHRFWP